jgi:hypothetical protein
LGPVQESAAAQSPESVVEVLRHVADLYGYYSEKLGFDQGATDDGCDQSSKWGQLERAALAHHLGETPQEIPSLRCVLVQGERIAVRGRRLGRSAQAAEEVGARGVQ